MQDTKTVAQNGRAREFGSASPAVSTLEEVLRSDPVSLFRYREIAFPAYVRWEGLLSRLQTSGFKFEARRPAAVTFPIEPAPRGGSSAKDDPLADFWGTSSGADAAPAPVVSLPPEVSPPPGPPRVAAPTLSEPDPAEESASNEPTDWSTIRLSEEPLPLDEPELLEELQPAEESVERSGLRGWGSIPVPAVVCFGLLALGLPMLRLADKSPVARDLASVATDSGMQSGIAMGEDGWKTEWASDPVGSSRGRQLTLYRPSAGLANYRFEFSGRIQNGSLGWVYRVADSKNYYLAKLEATGRGPGRRVDLVRYSIMDGRQSAASRKSLPVPVREDTVFQVRLDVRGPSFTLYLNGQPVDMWTDHQLARGGIGFSNERQETGIIERVRVDLLNDRTKR